MASNAVLVVVVILVAAGMAGVGFYAGYEYRGSPASNPTVVANSTLSILAAGTLNTLFPELADALVNETPGISAPTASQTYEGSLNVATALSTLATPADVAAFADYRIAPQLLEPTYAPYEIVFGSTPEVLVYNPSIAAFSGINSTNWGDKLIADVTTHGNAPFAVWNDSTDPNGYNAIFSLELQGELYGSGTSDYYDPLYSGGATSPAVPNSATTLIEKESQAATLISTGVVSAAITYRSYAVLNHMTYVSFDPIVGLASNSTTALSDYATLSTTILSTTGAFTKVQPAPVLFAVTVPMSAPNSALGAAFVHLLLSPEGAAILDQGGAFTPIFPGWCDRPSAVPSVLAPDVAPMPTWAAALVP
jgi:ABC-type molybdate transport system substrate-binding protein